MVNKAMGILILGLVAAFVIIVYQGVSSSANTTGWQPLVTQSVQSYWPMIMIVCVIIAMLTGITLSRRGK
jgi:hypothetical protein